MGVIKQLKKLITGEQLFPVTKSQAVYDDDLGRLDTTMKHDFAYMTEEELESGTVQRDADTLGGSAPSYFATAEKLKLERFPVGEVVQKIPDNSNLDNYTDVGVYAITATNTAKTITNIPNKVAGKLIVEESTGSSDLPLEDDASTYRYIIQTFLTYNNSGVYRRSGFRNPNTNIQWNPWDRMVMGSEYDTAIAKLNSDLSNKIQCVIFPCANEPRTKGNYYNLEIDISSLGLNAKNKIIGGRIDSTNILSSIYPVTINKILVQCFNITGTNASNMDVLVYYYE